MFITFMSRNNILFLTELMYLLTLLIKEIFKLWVKFGIIHYNEKGCQYWLCIFL